jgi:phenylalanyl-tRNA synthetase beta chain
MKFSYQWFEELVAGLAAGAADVGRQITMKTAECEGVERTPAGEDVIEIDNKSLTHRPDLWGHHGMAREVAAHFGLKLNEPADLSLLPVGAPAVDVRIEDYSLCPRFSAVMFENVTIQPSPVWMQRRLEAIGLNPINNIVDITNYVMAELPQPMHAFDADKVKDHALIARAAHEGETCQALNGETYALDPSMIVVAGIDGPLAIAGVMGGAPSMIGESTSRILFEAATWNAASIRKTSTRLRLRTDASMRFEKSLDPANTVRGLARAIALMKECCPGARLVGGLADAAAPASSPPVLDLPMEWLVRKLGRDIRQEEVAAILASIGFGVESNGSRLTVTVPSWRATKDISIADDLVEEVGRMVGYASITPVAPRMAVEPPPPNRQRAWFNRIREALRYSGFTEVQNYSFVSEADATRFGFETAAHLRVVNPIAEDQALLRVSLIPGIHRNVEENRKHFAAFRIFEIGNEIHKQPPEHPLERPMLAAAIYSKDDGQAALNELKRIASALAAVTFRPVTNARTFEHPARVAEVLHADRVIGRLFEFHPSFVEQGRAAALELDLAVLREIDASRAVRYQPIRRLPSSSFDLSIVVDARALVADVARELPGASFVDDYRLPDGRRSLTFRITLAAGDRTLTGEEIAARRAELIETLRSRGFDLRA